MGRGEEGVSYGAEGGTRTPTVLRPSAPQAGASANSATSAKRQLTVDSEEWSIKSRPGRTVHWSLCTDHSFTYFFAGAGAAGAGLAGVFCRIDPPELLVAQIAR